MTQESAIDLHDQLSRYDIYAEETPEIGDELLAYARSQCPVPHCSTNGGYYLVSRYDDVRAVLTNDAVFSSTGGKSLPAHQTLVMPPIDVDPPEHRSYRRLLNSYFSRTGIADSEPAIRRIARGLIEAFIDQAIVDINTEYATPLTSGTLCEVILSLDDDGLQQKAVRLVEAVGSNTADSWGNLTDFLADLLASHRPSSRGNVLDAIVGGEIDGRPLTADERLGVVTVLFLGGLDTTRAAITSIVRHMVADPSLEARLRNPAWVNRDLDEFLRMDSVVSALARTVTTPTELGGTKLSPGDRVLVHYYSANHDEEQFPTADQLDFDRGRNPHVAFGLGVHRCLGSNLARMQIAIAFDELLARVENIRGAGGDQRTTPGVSRMPREMPIHFDRRS